MSKAVKLSMVDMKALLPPMPVLANESQGQFEKFFDQVATTLDVQDPVELILIRDFVLASWELTRYTRHRVVAFDRKFKEILEGQLSHMRDQDARHQALAQRLAQYLGQGPADVSHLAKLEDKVMEADVEIADILKRTPSELAYNRALERNIQLHKDLEFLITNMTKRCHQALEMLDRYRNGLGRRVKKTMDEILDTEFGFVNDRFAEVLTQQIGPPLVPPIAPDGNREPDKPATVSTGGAKDDDDGRDD